MLDMKIQLLDDAGYPLQIEFVRWRWILDATQNDSQFPATVLFSDEAALTEKALSTHITRSRWRAH